MKQLYILFIAIIFTSITGCSKWIDVSPKTEVKASELYKTEDGFKSVLTGIYVRMAKDELYGNNLSYGFIEKLAQRYDNYPATQVTDQDRAKIYDYKNNESNKGTINNIWGEMYKDIANINEFLYYLDTEAAKVVKSKEHINLMKGEALGLRAFHYFDILRLWGPIYSKDKELKTAPYRTQFEPDKRKFTTADSLVNYILEDLQMAEKLLENDPLQYSSDSENPFFAYRTNRMNKFAVKALMARVYIYKDDKENAIKYAKDVIKNSGKKLNRDNYTDKSLHGETLFSLSVFKIKDRVRGAFNSNTDNFNQELWISDINAREAFEVNSVGVNDIRYKNGYGFIHKSSRLILRKYFYELDTEAGYIPLIRLSEMYYILAEALPVEEGVSYINKVRNNRGIPTYNNYIATDLNYSKMLDELKKEYRKDFFGEGQFFYFLKRHFYETFYRCPLTKMNENNYIFSIPDNEVEHGLGEKRY